MEYYSAIKKKKSTVDTQILKDVRFSEEKINLKRPLNNSIYVRQSYRD